MEMAGGYGPKGEIGMNHPLKGNGIGLNSNTLLIIKLPDSRVLRVMSRSVFLAMVILTLPSIGSLISGPSVSPYESEMASDSIGFETVPLVLRDLADEGLLREGHKALIVSSRPFGIGYLKDSFSKEIEIGLIFESDSDSQSSVKDEAFDLVFTPSFRGSTFIDRVLKIGGIVVMQLSNNPSNAFRQQSNYKIVYLRRFGSTVVAMRKMASEDENINIPTYRRLCGVTPEAKKAALKGLEDVLLEPPRRALGKSRNSLKKFNFLPDLLEDSLEGYNRRIFITDGNNNGVSEWFHQNYPKRDQFFETYNLEMEVYNAETVEKLPMIGISDWLRKNVKEEEFVVMKAEAQAVEEMMREETICLVDELFLECKNQWEDDGGGEEESKGMKKAYWECLALYGRLRDEGVAVHQWWG